MSSADGPYRPPQASVGDVASASEEGALVGLGGWLVLPILGLFIAPIRLGFMLWTGHLPIFTDGTWELLTSAGSASHHFLWAPLLVFEVAGNLTMITLCAVALVLAFRRSRRFPGLMVGYYLFALVFAVADTIAAEAIPGIAELSETESLGDVGRAIIAAGIWVPYMLLSKRVRATFVE